MLHAYCCWARCRLQIHGQCTHWVFQYLVTIQSVIQASWLVVSSLPVYLFTLGCLQRDDSRGIRPLSSIAIRVLRRVLQHAGSRRPYELVQCAGRASGEVFNIPKPGTVGRLVPTPLVCYPPRHFVLCPLNRLCQEMLGAICPVHGVESTPRIKDTRCRHGAVGWQDLDKKPDASVWYLRWLPLLTNVLPSTQVGFISLVKRTWRQLSQVASSMSKRYLLGKSLEKDSRTCSPSF